MAGIQNVWNYTQILSGICLSNRNKTQSGRYYPPLSSLPGTRGLSHPSAVTADSRKGARNNGEGKREALLQRQVSRSSAPVHTGSPAGQWAAGSQTLSQQTRTFPANQRSSPQSGGISLLGCGRPGSWWTFPFHAHGRCGLQLGW